MATATDRRRQKREAAEGAGRSRREADEKVSQREKITAEPFLRKKEKTQTALIDAVKANLEE